MSGALAAMLGAAVRYQLAATGTYQDTDVSPTTQTTYGLSAAGVEQYTLLAGSGAVLGNWIEPPARAPNGCYVRCTVNSGALSSGTVGTWIDLATGPNWTVTRSANGLATANITIEIARDAAGSQIVASATFTIAALVAP